MGPFYDPLGLALHPLTALINHSCNYNAVVRFDFPSQSMTISALRPITSGEQILISYIDATNPYDVRQAELQDRYFFTCKCTKCSSELIKKQSIPYSPEPEEHLLVQSRAYELLNSARKDTSVTGPIQKLKYGIHILQKTRSWPLHRQPLASLRQQLVVSLTAAGQLHLAFIHAWIQYRLIDPELMPEKHHPLRLIHQWLVISLLRRIDPPSRFPEDLPTQKYNILDKPIDFQTITSYVLSTLNEELKGDDSTFSVMVIWLYGLPERERAFKIRAKFNEEAEKLSHYVTEILDMELVWGDAT
jgi:SET domain